jgi:hypothetical protein
MAFLRMMRRPEGSPAQYDAITAQLDLDENPPYGLLLHTACSADGVWTLIELWLSEEQAAEFDRRRRDPVLGRLLGERADAYEMSSCEVHSLLIPGRESL